MRSFLQPFLFSDYKRPKLIKINNNKVSRQEKQSNSKIESRLTPSQTMGNQALNNDLKRVMEKDFDDKKLEQYLTKLWTFEDLESMRYKQISSEIVNVSDQLLAQQFPTQCTVEPFKEENVGKSTPNKFIRENTVSAGFTSGEKKIDILRQEDVKLLRVENNQKSIEFESAMHGKIGILTAALLTRHKGGDSIEDFLTYASKEESDYSATHQMSSAFDVALLCNLDSLNFLLTSQPAFLAAVLEKLLEQARATDMGSLCEKNSIKSLGSDVKLKQMRKLLTAIARSSSAETAMKTLAVRLLLRLGYVFATAEDMLLAADLQAELKLDVTWELMPLLDKSEKMRSYVPPARPGDGSGEKWSMKEETCTQGHVTFTGVTDNTLCNDAGICDDKYYYMFSSDRGLFKGLMRDSDYYWEDSSGCKSVKSEYKNLTFVLIDGQVHLRSSHLAEEPFVLLDKETCKVKEGYEPWTSEGSLLNWSKTDTDSTEGDQEKGFRYLRATQMHYHDGELWIVAPYYESNYESSIKRLVVEVWKKEGRHFTRTQEIPLTKEDGVTSFQGAKRRKHEYLDRGMLHKNSEHIILHSAKTIHVFDRTTGQRIKKDYWGQYHVIFHNKKAKQFAWMDCACYSYHKLITINGYDPMNQIVAEIAKEVELPVVELPVVLDETKQAIKKALMEQNEEETKEEVKEGEEGKEGEEAKEVKKKQKQRNKPKANNVRYLMGLDDKDTRELSTEAVPAIQNQIPNIHAQSKAIIYSFVNVEANYALKGAQFRQDSPPFGSDMIPFFKAPYSVYLNRDFMMMISKNLTVAVQATQGESPDILNQVSLLTMLNLFSATISSIKCCRMQVQQILNTEEMVTLKDTVLPSLSQVMALESSTTKEPKDMTQEEAMAINCVAIARPVQKILLTMLDSVSAGEKLQRISSGLNSSSPESVEILMVMLADKSEMSKLFSDTAELKDLLPALNGCCFVVNQSLKRVLQGAIREKRFSSDLDNEFSQAASSLQSMICQELCAAYGDQLWTILENKDKARGPKPDSMTDEEFNKCQNQYNGAVEGVKNLDKILYQAFINIAEHIKFQMNQLSQMIEGIDTATWSESDLNGLMQCFKALFSRDASILRSSMLFSLFFASFEVDVTWLDEIAEGLKHVLTAVNATLLNIKGIRLDSSPLHSLDENGFVIYMQNVLRQISYTTGWVAGRLIQQKQEEDETLGKLNILQGGIENRFIPGLSEATKIQIEGSFKITGDKQLQKLALSEAESIVLESEDTLLRDIISNGDSVKLTLEVLQQALQTKMPMCVFARLGGQAGSEISRSAFAVLIKFSQTEVDFEGLNNEVAQLATEVTSDGVQKLKDIIGKLKESSNSDYDVLLKRWESANQMRKWTQQIKLNISERTAVEAEEAYRKEVNDANPSAEPLTGSLSDEQKRIVEERSNTKFDEDLKTTYEGVVQKAYLLIKLQVPSAYKAQKGKPRLGQLQNQTSIIAQEKHVEQANLHIMIQQQTEKKDSEYDWTDRLKQWKKVQLAEGAIVDLSSKKQLNSQSASIAILGLLQSEFSYEKINQTLENSLINGLRRMAGLNLLNHAMGLQGSHQLFFDMIQWFSASLRQRQQTSAHFLDGLSGCGNSCESGIRSQFFKIIKKIILELKISINQDEIKLLLNVLCWNFKTTDHEDLAKSGVFEMLSKGNGSDLDWVSYNMGNYRWHRHALFEDDMQLSSLNLGRTLQQTCEYIQNQVLAGIIETDNEVASIESKQSQAKMTQAQQTLDEAASTIIFQQMSDLVFDNISRSLTINRMAPSCSRIQTKAKFEMAQYEQSTRDCGQDENSTRSVVIDCKARNPAIKTHEDFQNALQKSKQMQSIKFNMFVHKIVKEQKTEGVTEVLETFLKQKVGPALGLRNLSQIIEFVKARDLVIQSLLLHTSFEELGMTEPVPPVTEETKEESKEENTSEIVKPEEAEEEVKAENEEQVAATDESQANAEEEKKEVPAVETEKDRLNNICKDIREISDKLKVDEPQMWNEDLSASTIDSVPQYRMVMQLEQLIGIAEKNSLVNSLLQESLHPSKIQSLIELAAQAHPHVQQLVQRIFQILLRMEIPSEIFEGAIEACPKVDQRGVPTRVAKLLAKKGVLSFPESKFLQILCNLVQETYEKRSTRDNFMFIASWDATVETVRTLRVLQTHQNKNKALSSLLKNQLKDALLSVESKSQAEVETLFFLMGETRPLHNWNVGQVVRAGDGEIYTILNTDSARKGRHLLYNDIESPKRQEFVMAEVDKQALGKLFAAKMQPLHDLHEVDTESAAKNSVLMDPEVIKKLLTLLKDGVSNSLVPISARILESSINRGFMNMLTTLKLEYVSLLNEHNLFNQMIGYLVSVAGESSAKFDESLRDTVQKDMHLVSRTQNWTSRAQGTSEYYCPQKHACEIFNSSAYHRCDLCSATMSNDEENKTPAGFFRCRQCDYDACRKCVPVNKGDERERETKIYVHGNKEHTQAIFNIPTFDYSGKVLTQLRHYEFVQYKQYVFSDEEHEGEEDNENSLSALNLDIFSLYDLAETYTTTKQYFISSKNIQVMSFSTANVLFSSRVVWTDDEIPIEQLLNDIRTSLKEDKILSKVVNANFAPRIIVLAKADYDRVYTWCSTGQFSNLDRPIGQCLDTRAIVMNDLCNRIRRTNTACASDGSNDCINGEKHIAKMFVALTESKPIPELMQVLLDSFEDEDIPLKDQWKSCVEDVKNGVAFQMPPSEEQVEETKKKLVMGISAMFKQKQPAATIPNFNEMFISSEQALALAGSNFPERPDKQSWQTGAYENHYHKNEVFLEKTDYRQNLGQMQELYDEYKTANQAICRNSLMTILESAGNSLNESSRSLLNQEEMMTKLDDLIHNEHMMHSHQSICFDDKQNFQKSEEKITNALKLFGQSPPIKQFLVEDFFKRGKETIQKLAKEDWQKYRESSNLSLVMEWRKIIELEEILDPVNILLLSKQFIEQGFIEDEQLPESLIAFIDLCLIYSTVLQKDSYASVTDDLLKHIIYLTAKISDNLALFRGKTELITRLFENKLLGTLMSAVDVSEMKKKQNYQTCVEIAQKITELQGTIRTELGETIQIQLNFPAALDKLFSAIDVLKEGTRFSSQMNKIKFATLLEVGDSQIAHLAQSYTTADKRFTTEISKTFGPKDEDWTMRVSKMSASEFISAQTDDGQIMCDKAGLASGGLAKLVCKAGQTLTIKFPVKPTLVKWTGCLKSRHGQQEHLQRLTGYDVMMETAAISPVQLLGTSNHLTFVAADGSIYGLGSRIQAYHGDDEAAKEKFRKIDFPEGLSASDIKKVHIAKFARLIWTKDGRFFHNGQHKAYMWGPTRAGTVQEDVHGFVEMNKDWFRNGDDKIVDWVCGKHNNTVLTGSGKMICSGYKFYQQFASNMRSNDENYDYEVWPFKVPAPEGYNFALKAFPSYKMFCVFVNWKDAAGKIRSFRIGAADTDSSELSGQWRELDLPEGGHFKQISATRHFAYGICDKDKLWVWGHSSELDEHLVKDGTEGVSDCLETRTWGNGNPNLFQWFVTNKLKPLSVKTGALMAIVLTENPEGKKQFYGIGKQTLETHNGVDNVFPNRFGENAKAVYGSCIYLITDIDADQVADYAVTYQAAAYLLKGDNKKQVSIVPDKPDATGLTHFFKKDGNWAFVTDDEYDEKKVDLPDLCFATRHPISNFSDKSFADLPALQSQLTLAAEGEPQYFAKFTLTGDDSDETKVTASEDMARQGGQQYDMNPVIFVRTSKPCANALDILPSIKLTDFFSQTEENEVVAFDMQRTKLNDSDLETIEVRDEASKKFISDLKSLTPDQDAQIMSQLDAIAQKKSIAATSIKPGTINPSEFTWGKENTLAKMDEKVVKLRCKLLLSLVKSWQTIEKISDLKDKDIPGTVSNLLFTKKYLVPPSVLSVIVDKAVGEVDSGYGPTVAVSRLRAKAFEDSGKIDDEGKYTIYGQIIQQLVSDQPEMGNFRIKSTDEKCYSINFKGEGSIDAGGPFRESLTNIAQELESGVVPILIRSPNNKNEHGTNRECFILDSRSKTPSHKFMLRYYGAFLAYAFLSKSPIPFNLAPWVWKQLLHEKVTLHDLDGIDAYSAQVLRDMQQHAQNMSDEDFQYGVDQNFTTVLSCGDEVPLCDNGENIKVTKTNIGEFIDKVMEARSKEATEQVEAIREGFLKVIQEKTQILDFLDWETFERRCTGDKKISVERLKTITSFPNNGADHEIIPRFWRVFEAFNDAERAAYLKFIWGRCRLPIDLGNLSYKHQVRLIEGMNKTAFPQAHTCFFQLDIPNYETDEMMSQRLRVAAELCGEMDTDNGAAEDID